MVPVLGDLPWNSGGGFPAVLVTEPRGLLSLSLVILILRWSLSQAGTTCGPHASASPGAGISGGRHHARLGFIFYAMCILCGDHKIWPL